MGDNAASRDSMAHILLDYVWNSGSVIMILFDDQGVVVDANASARRNLRCETGRSAAEIFVSFQGPPDIAALARQNAEGQILSVNTHGNLPESISFSFRPVGGRILAVGEIDYAEIEILRTNLFETNNALSNMARNLQKNNAELARLNNIKNDLLGVAAHDLRTPIGAIKTYADLLLLSARPLLPEQHINFLTTIQSLSELMMKMLGDLLDITAIEAGRIRLQIDKVDLCAVARESVQIHSVLAQRKNMSVELQAAEDAIIVPVDEFKIRQVFDNLLGNALKFSPQGSTVWVTVNRLDDQCHIVVEDEGPGIPPDELEMIFRPFTRSRAAPTGGEKSTGLGLAIVHKIVTAHRGTVSAENRDGKGAAFRVVLRTDPEAGKDGTL